MSRIQPFRGIRPRPEVAARIASPPYDVVSGDEARALVRDEPLCFMRVLRPEVDFAADAAPAAAELHAHAADVLRGLLDEGQLVRDGAPRLYLYRQQVGAHSQTGVMAGASVAEYIGGQVKTHEQTRPAKVSDRAGHIATTGAQAGPVFLTYRARPAIDALVDRLCRARPEVDFTADDGVRHALWVVAGEDDLGALTQAFEAVPALYIADGHHRAAAAAAVHEDLGAGPGTDWFLTVSFPHDQLRILGYHRVVKDLNGMSEDAFLEAVRERFEVDEGRAPEPEAPRQIGMFLANRWYRLTVREGTDGLDDPVRGLDASLLQDHLLGPVLGIADPRTDARVDFVGGARGTGELERRCEPSASAPSGSGVTGAAVAFALHPVTIDQLLAVADAGRNMPPKSTWFEPKLRSGLVVRSLEE